MLGLACPPPCLVNLDTRAGICRPSMIVASLATGCPRGNACKQRHQGCCPPGGQPSLVHILAQLCFASSQSTGTQPAVCAALCATKLQAWMEGLGLTCTLTLTLCQQSQPLPDLIPNRLPAGVTTGQR